MESSAISVDPVCLLASMAAAHTVIRCQFVSYLATQGTQRIVNHNTQVKTKTNVQTPSGFLKGELQHCCWESEYSDLLCFLNLLWCINVLWGFSKVHLFNLDTSFIQIRREENTYVCIGKYSCHCPNLEWFCDVFVFFFVTSKKQQKRFIKWLYILSFQCACVWPIVIVLLSGAL